MRRARAWAHAQSVRMPKRSTGAGKTSPSVGFVAIEAPRMGHIRSLGAAAEPSVDLGTVAGHMCDLDRGGSPSVRLCPRRQSPRPSPAESPADPARALRFSELARVP